MALIQDKDALVELEALIKMLLEEDPPENKVTSVMWKLNPGVITITLTKITNYTCKLHTKEIEYGAEH